MAITGEPENPLATMWTCDNRKLPSTGLLTMTSGAFTATLVVAVDEAPELSVTVAVSV